MTNKDESSNETISHCEDQPAPSYETPAIRPAGNLKKSIRMAS